MGYEGVSHRSEEERRGLHKVRQNPAAAFAAAGGNR